MDDLNVVGGINSAGGWLVRNQALLLSYAVNIVAAIAIIIIGMTAARIISRTVNKAAALRVILIPPWRTSSRLWCVMASLPSR